MVFPCTREHGLYPRCAPAEPLGLAPPAVDPLAVVLVSSIATVITSVAVRAPVVMYGVGAPMPFLPDEIIALGYSLR